MKIDVNECCQLFYRSTGIPLSVIDLSGQHTLFPKLPDRTDFSLYLLSKNDTRPLTIQHSDSQNLYGRILLPDGRVVILGPVLSTSVTETLVSEYMRTHYILPDQRNAAKMLLDSTPRLERATLMNKMTFLFYALTGKVIHSGSEQIPEDAIADDTMNAEHTTRQIISQETHSYHNTYRYEEELLSLVRDGNSEQLKAFLASYGDFQFNTGIVGDTPLRQQKNLLIGTLVKLGKDAAIPGGVDVEKTYQLIDDYSQECEHADNTEQVEKLLYLAIMDFCRHVEVSKMPEGITPEIYRCVCFIRAHTNDPIGLNDVAEDLGRSKSYLVKRFSSEVGTSVGKFITISKMADAARLLTYTNRTLAEISAYLCYSNQPHFQNTFKRHFGVTPLQYRRQHQL
jgi:AraC-like DNA-binding protein